MEETTKVPEKRGPEPSAASRRRAARRRASAMRDRTAFKSSSGGSTSLKRVDVRLLVICMYTESSPFWVHEHLPQSRKRPTMAALHRIGRYVQNIRCFLQRTVVVVIQKEPLTVDRRERSRCPLDFFRIICFYQQLLG